MAILDWIIGVIRDPGELIRWGGYPGLSLVVFAETGALIFFLPGDSLLVMAGVYAAKGDLSMWWLNGLLIPAAALGGISSYWLASRIGPKMFTSSDSRLLKPEYLVAAHAFYEKHGGKAIVLARFLPIVRTFVPVVAGAARMDYKRYTFFNVIGAAAWVLSMTLIGYALGTSVPNLEKHIEKVAIIVIAVSLLPGFIGWMRHRRAKAAAAPPGA